MQFQSPGASVGLWIPSERTEVLALLDLSTTPLRVHAWFQDNCSFVFVKAGWGSSRSSWST